MAAITAETDLHTNYSLVAQRDRGDDAKITISSCSRGRKAQGYPGTLSRCAFDPRFATMEHGNALNDREAQAGAAIVLRPSRIDPMKAVKNARQVLCRDATAVIRNRHKHGSVVTLACQTDVPAGIRVG